MGDEEQDDKDKPGSSRREFLVTTGLGAAALVVACGDDASPVDGGLDGTLPDASSDVGFDGALPDVGVDGARPDVGTDAGTDTGVDAGTDAGVDAPTDAPTDAAPGTGPDATPENAGAFPFGVSAGDPSTTGAVIWTRYTGSSTLRAALWVWDGSAYGRQLVDEIATPADGGFVHVTVAGLSAGQRYRYAFFEMTGAERTARSPIGNFRASIADDAMVPLRFGAISCQRNGRDFATLRHAGGRDDLDAFLLLGDTTYNDGSRSLADFRAKWAENLGTSEYKALLASVGVYATWDDHEVDNNWNPETESAATVRAAFDSFFEHMPLGRVAGEPDRIWRSQRWGQTLEIFVLDCRSERLPSTRTDADGQYLSPEQMTWLKTGLADSPAVFKVIMNSVGITDFPFGSAADRWQGYAAQRTELLRHVEDGGITGVLWVAGDFHYACLGHVGRNSSSLGWNQWEVLVGPGAQTSNPAYLISRPPQFPVAFGNNNYTELQFEPTTGEVTIIWWGRDNRVIERQTITP